MINQNKNVDIICLATNDGGYADVITELRQAGKKVVVIGEKRASEKLKKSCNRFVERNGRKRMMKQGVDHGFPLGFEKTSGKNKRQAAKTSGKRK